MAKIIFALSLGLTIGVASTASAAPVLKSCELFVQQSAGKSQAAIDDGIRQIVADLATKATVPGSNLASIKGEISACAKLVADLDLAVQIQQIALAITKQGTLTASIGGSASPN